MQVIVQGNRDYHKFFLPQKKDTEEKYTRSHFLLKQETEEGILLCSTMTGELVLLSPDERQALECCDTVEASSVTNELITHRYLIPLKSQEDLAVDQVRALMMKRMEAKHVIATYRILPTTYCNARCFYCYESGIRHVHMTEETADNMVKFIAAHRGEAPVTLRWFGGEPMMGRHQIDRICSGLNRLNIAYVSTMTSNGYLFDADLVEHAKEEWKLKHIQITLDGTREIYNHTKAYIAPIEDPYNRVLRNIGSLARAGIYVKIRLNMDNHNGYDLENLITELSDRFRERKFLSVYVTSLDENEGFAPITHTPEDREMLKKRLGQLRGLLEEKGWPQFGDTMLPKLVVSSCIADDPCSIQCTPDGILSKCTGRIYENAVGNLSEDIIDHEKELWWRQREPFEGCGVCPLYPSCIRLLKNCPDRKTGCDEDARKRRIAEYEALMLLKYHDWKRRG